MLCAAPMVLGLVRTLHTACMGFALGLVLHMAHRLDPALHAAQVPDRPLWAACGTLPDWLYRLALELGWVGLGYAKTTM